MPCVNKGNQIVSNGFCAGGRGRVVDLETDGLNREGKAVSQGLLLMGSLGLKRGLLYLSPTSETPISGSHQPAAVQLAPSGLDSGDGAEQCGCVRVFFQGCDSVRCLWPACA